MSGVEYLGGTLRRASLQTRERVTTAAGCYSACALILDCDRFTFKLQQNGARCFLKAAPKGRGGGGKPQPCTAQQCISGKVTEAERKALAATAATAPQPVPDLRPTVDGGVTLYYDREYMGGTLMRASKATRGKALNASGCRLACVAAREAGCRKFTFKEVYHHGHDVRRSDGGEVTPRCFLKTNEAYRGACSRAARLCVSGAIAE